MARVLILREGPLRAFVLEKTLYCALFGFFLVQLRLVFCCSLGGCLDTSIPIWIWPDCYQVHCCLCWCFNCS